MGKTPRTRFLTTVAVALVAALLGGLTAAWAGGQTFTDVPPSQGNFAGIEAAAAAGIVTGFTGSQCTSDGLTSPCFKPGDPITRGQAAGQMLRALPRIAQDSNSAINNPADGATQTVGEVAMTAGGTDPTHTGYVLVMGQVDVAGDETADCPCRLTIEVRNVNTNDVQGTVTEVIDVDSDCVLGLVCGTVQTQHVYAAGNTTAGNTFRTQARLSTVGDNTGWELDGNVIAMYVPFDGNPIPT